MSAEPIRQQPEWLTVEEAARVLRIGRTKAYALTREWRETGGRSGLPVADLGDVLRVPRRALEELIEATLPPRRAQAARPGSASSTPLLEATTPAPRPRQQRARPRRPHTQDQLTLIDLTDPAS